MAHHRDTLAYVQNMYGLYETIKGARERPMLRFNKLNRSIEKGLDLNYMEFVAELTWLTTLYTEIYQYTNRFMRPETRDDFDLPKILTTRYVLKRVLSRYSSFPLNRTQQLQLYFGGTLHPLSTYKATTEQDEANVRIMKKLYFVSDGNIFVNLHWYRYTWKSKSIPDCGETTVLNILNLLMWDNELKNIDIKLLPSTVDKRVRKFYTTYTTTKAINTPRAHQAWAMIISSMPGIAYLKGNTELHPFKDNVFKVICKLTGAPTIQEAIKSFNAHLPYKIDGQALVFPTYGARFNFGGHSHTTFDPVIFSIDEGELATPALHRRLYNLKQVLQMPELKSWKDCDKLLYYMIANSADISQNITELCSGGLRASLSNNIIDGLTYVHEASTSLFQLFATHMQGSDLIKGLVHSDVITGLTRLHELSPVLCQSAINASWLTPLMCHILGDVGRGLDFMRTMVSWDSRNILLLETTDAFECLAQSDMIKGLTMMHELFPEQYQLLLIRNWERVMYYIIHTGDLEANLELLHTMVGWDRRNMSLLSLPHLINRLSKSNIIGGLRKLHELFPDSCQLLVSDKRWPRSVAYYILEQNIDKGLTLLQDMTLWSAGNEALLAKPVIPDLIDVFSSARNIIAGLKKFHDIFPVLCQSVIQDPRWRHSPIYHILSQNIDTGLDFLYTMVAWNAGNIGLIVRSLEADNIISICRDIFTSFRRTKALLKAVRKVPWTLTQIIDKVSQAFDEDRKLMITNFIQLDIITDDMLEIDTSEIDGLRKRRGLIMLEMINAYMDAYEEEEPGAFSKLERNREYIIRRSSRPKGAAAL